MADQHTAQAGSALAANLIRLRRAAGVSVADLARRAGVSRGTLTALEAGRGNPRLETLYALAGVLGVSLATLIDTATPAAPVVVRATEGAVTRGKRLSARLLMRLDQVTDLYELVVQDGEPHRSEPHAHGVVEVLFVHAGRLRAGPAHAPVDLDPGDAAMFPADVAHVYTSLSSEPARALLAIRTPSPAGGG